MGGDVAGQALGRGLDDVRRLERRQTAIAVAGQLGDANRRQDGLVQVGRSTLSKGLVVRSEDELGDGLVVHEGAEEGTEAEGPGVPDVAQGETPNRIVLEKQDGEGDGPVVADCVHRSIEDKFLDAKVRIVIEFVSYGLELVVNGAVLQIVDVVEAEFFRYVIVRIGPRSVVTSDSTEGVSECVLNPQVDDRSLSGNQPTVRYLYLTQGKA